MKNILFNVYTKLRLKLIGHGLGKYKIVQKTTNYTTKVLHPDHVIHNGNKFYIDKNDTNHYSNTVMYEDTEFPPPMPNHILKIIHDSCIPGNIVVDVGANIGWYTLSYAKLVGSTGKVFAFEPISENFELLRKNVSVNNYNNVFCEQKAVSNENKKVTMEISDRIGDHRIIENKKSSNATLQVNCLTLDEFFKQEQKNDFLKIDTEGFDLHVLQGAENIIKKNKNIVICIEFNPTLLHQNNIQPKSLLNFITSLGFTIFDIDQDENIPSTNNYLLNKYDNGQKDNLTDLLCIRQ